MDIEAAGFKLNGLGRVSVILGKNGCGKSSLLKAVDGGLTDGPEARDSRYMPPERGGPLSFVPEMEHNLTADKSMLRGPRRVNQMPQFRQQSVAQFRRLEHKVHVDAEQRGVPADFNPYVERLNSLLDNIELRRAEPTFKIFSRHDPAQELGNESISSGESELISLGIEILAYSEDIDGDKDNFLLLDEPDVHLHPDLQSRLVKFLVELAADSDFRVIIATHSTAILGSLAGTSDGRVAFMQARQKELNFEQIGEILRRVLPVFGAHPLSNVFNQAPILIVEGGDDERIWQQAIRSSGEAIALYPVSSEGVADMHAYEQEVIRIINAVYENAQGYSLRDRDGTNDEMDDEPPLLRMKLACRSAENLIVTDDVVQSCGLTWADAEVKINDWIAKNPGHEKHDNFVAFRDGGFDRFGADVKAIRTLLVGEVLDSTKSWEVLVGQNIAKLVSVEEPAEHSLQTYLGGKTVRLLLRRAD